MPVVRNLRPGYTVTYPNRGKAASRATKLLVVLIMLASVVLMLAITIGGWSELQGLVPVNFACCIAYLVMAFYIWRWARGLLPIAAGLAILLLIICLIAGTGASGASWFARSGLGYQASQSLFGGAGLSADTLGVLTLLLAPTQLLLIFFAMRGFAQGWNVEVEVPIDTLRVHHGPGAPSGTAPGGSGALPAAL